MDDCFTFFRFESLMDDGFSSILLEDLANESPNLDVVGRGDRDEELLGLLTVFRVVDILRELGIGWGSLVFT